MRQLGVIALLLALALLAGCAKKQADAPANPPTDGAEEQAAAPANPSADGAEEQAAAPANPPTDSAPKGAELSFGSFDGGGPEYTVLIDDPDVLACKRSSYYAKEDHDQMPGAGYTVWYTFTGLKPGATTVTVESRSPIMPDCDTIYAATVDEALNVTLTETETRYPGMPQQRPMLVLSANDEIRYAHLEPGETADAFIERLSPEPLTLTLDEDDGLAKSAALPFALSFAVEDAEPEPGDLVLYEDGRLGLCYGEGARPLALLARMPGETAEEVLDFLGEDAVLTLSLEWPE